MNRTQYLYGRHFRVREASLDDVPYVAAHLREGDRLELERFYEDPPEAVLHGSLLESRMAWTAIAPDDTPVAIWGAAAWPTDPTYGCPWLLGTDLIKESMGDFLWLSRRFVKVMDRQFLGLANLVDAQYAEAVRWLEWLGFQKGDTVKSRKNYDFIVMYKDQRNVR